MDFSNLLVKALPWIGAAATGNVPALITLAAKQVAETLGVEVKADPASISNAVANATPEQLIELRKSEAAFQERMQAMGFAHIEDMEKLAIQETKIYIDDTADARMHNAADDKVFWLGIAVLTTFAVLMTAVLYGCFKLITTKEVIDTDIIAIVAGLIGTVVGYVAANAQQVVSYFFGSSKGSRENGSRIGNALTESMKQLGATK